MIRSPRIVVPVSIVLWLCVVVCLFIPLTADASVFGPTFTPKDDDGSLYYLMHYFFPPSVGLPSIDRFIPDATGEGPIPAIIGEYNKIVYTFAIVILVYTIVKSLLNTATSGKFLGERASMWLPLRTAVGMVLIYPSAGSAWNLAQTFTIYLIVAAVGAADTVWDKAWSLGKLLGSPPLAKASTLLNNSNTQSIIKYMFEGAVCNIKSEQTDVITPKSKQQQYYINKFAVDFRSGQGAQIALPNSQNALAAYIRWGSPVATGTNDININCGQLAMGNAQGNTYLAYADALSDFVISYNVAPMSKMQLRVLLNGQDKKAVMQKLGGITYNFLNSARIQVGNPASGDTVGNDRGVGAVKHVSKYGWVTSGFFYRSIASGSGGTAEYQLTQLNDVTSPENIDNSITDLGEELVSAQNLRALTSAVASYEQTGHSGGPGGSFLDNDVASKVLDALTGINNPGSAWLLTLFSNWGAALSAITRIATAFAYLAGTGGALDPFQGPVNAGYELMTGAAVLLTTTPIRIFFNNFIQQTCRGESNPAQAASAASYFISMTIIALSLTMYTEGSMLAVFLPMIPMLIFLSAVVGWFIAVIQSLVAAPLVGVALMWPEGQHDLLGKAESALMMYLNLFLRPPLIVFGLIGAVVITYIGFKLVSDSFLFAINNGGIGGIGAAGPFGLVALGLAYAYVLMFIAQHAYSLINELPNRILQWVGGGVIAFGRGDDFISGAREGTMGGAGAVGQGGKSLIEDAAAHNRNQAEEIAKAKGDTDSLSVEDHKAQRGGDGDAQSDDDTDRDDDADQDDDKQQDDYKHGRRERKQNADDHADEDSDEDEDADSVSRGRKDRKHSAPTRTANDETTEPGEEKGSMVGGRRGSRVTDDEILPDDSQSDSLSTRGRTSSVTAADIIDDDTSSVTATGGRSRSSSTTRESITGLEQTPPGAPASDVGQAGVPGKAPEAKGVGSSDTVSAPGKTINQEDITRRDDKNADPETTSSDPDDKK